MDPIGTPLEPGGTDAAPADGLPHSVDRRLVARAQARAGRRVHVLGNLLQSYYAAALLLDRAAARGATSRADDVHLYVTAEAELQRFALGN